MAEATPLDLRMRYPAFRDVANDDIAYWLQDARRFVSDSWGEDAVPAQIAYAAHYLVVNNVPGVAKTALEKLPAGVTRFRSASVDVALSETAANRSVTGGFEATKYGREFRLMQRRNAGGPYLVGCV